jgi:hypothetical protein
VLEEAHAYLQNGDVGAAAITVRRLAKEGRKYGLGLMIVSQRPAEVDSTILSQCGSVIALRLSNDTDRNHVAGAISDNLESLTKMLPVLRTGEAIVFGECVHLPVRLLTDPPPESDRPDSADPLAFDGLGPSGWNRRREPGSYSSVVEHWRRQDARVERGVPMERVPVNSTNVVSIGYDPAQQVLELEYRNGHIYQYFDVSEGTYQELMASASIGQYVNTVIKGAFRYARL